MQHALIPKNNYRDPIALPVLYGLQGDAISSFEWLVSLFVDGQSGNLFIASIQLGEDDPSGPNLSTRMRIMRRGQAEWEIPKQMLLVVEIGDKVKFINAHSGQQTVYEYSVR